MIQEDIQMNRNDVVTSEQLVDAALTWAVVAGEHDEAEWKAWDAAWHEASDEVRRDALRMVALRLRDEVMA